MGIFRRREPVVSAENFIPSGGPFRFLVEDVFTITGRGTVFVGVVETGTVQVGHTVIVSTQLQNFHAKVAGVETFRKRQHHASAGQNAGLLLDLSPHTPGDRASFRGAIIHS